MSTPTAIEVVRAQNDWWLTHNSFMPPHTRSEYAAAIASVLADAERFQALEAAAYIEVRKTAGGCDHRARRENGWTHIYATSLAELADRLRKET